MEFSALAYMKNKYRNCVDAKYRVMLSYQFKTLLKRNGCKCCVVKVLLFMFCFFFLIYFFSNYLVGAQLFLKKRFLSEFGSQKKIVEKYCRRHMLCCYNIQALVQFSQKNKINRARNCFAKGIQSTIGKYLTNFEKPVTLQNATSTQLTNR